MFYVVLSQTLAKVVYRLNWYLSFSNACYIWELMVCLKCLINQYTYKLVFCHSQMLAKFAEDDRIEQMNAQRRRMKQQEHKRAVEKLIEERRKQHEMDKVS